MKKKIPLIQTKAVFGKPQYNRANIEKRNRINVFNNRKPQCKAILLFISVLLLVSCNSRNDINHLSQKDMIDYVERVIDEDISLISVDDNEDNVLTYIFKLNKRNITFKITSSISALTIDGSRFGNYKRNIQIKYEESIVESEYYKAKRLKIAKNHNINGEYLGYGLAIIHIDNYKGIDKVAQYIVELDRLYAFNEKMPESIYHINSGTISFNKNSIEGLEFSTNKNNRLQYDDVYNKIVKSYIEQLKKFNNHDNTIPKNVWEKYN